MIRTIKSLTMLLLIALIPALFLQISSINALTPSFTYVTVNKYELFISPYNLTNISLLLQNASESIYAELYELTYQHIINILAEKAEQGLQVYVVLSAYTYDGIPYSEEEAVQYLENHGVHVKFLSNFYYVHSKVFVIDNRTTIISTNNPTYYGLTEDKGLAIAIYNKTISTWFATIILNDYKGYFPAYTYPGLVVSPINSYYQLYGLFSSPSSTIYAAFEEIYSDSGLTNALLSHQKHIIITTRNDVGLPTTYDLTAKVAVVGNYTYIGSINLSNTSLFQNRELGIIIKNDRLAVEIASIIENWSGYTTTNHTSLEHYQTSTNYTTYPNSSSQISHFTKGLEQITESINKNTMIALVAVVLFIISFYVAVEKKK